MFGEPQSIEVGGQRYKLAACSVKTLLSVMEWANQILPKPIDLVAKHVKDLPPDLGRQLVYETLAESKARKAIDAPEVQSLLNSLEGLIKLFGLMLAENHPEADAVGLFGQCLKEQGMDYVTSKIAGCVGKLPGGGNDQKKVV